MSVHSCASAPLGAAVVVLLHKHRGTHVEGVARHKVLALPGAPAKQKAPIPRRTGAKHLHCKPKLFLKAMRPA